MKDFDVVSFFVKVSTDAASFGNEKSFKSITTYLSDHYVDDLRVINLGIDFLILQKKYTEAIEQILLVTEQYPKDFQLAIKLIRCYFFLGRIKEMSSKLVNLIQDFQDNIDVLLQISDFALSIGSGDILKIILPNLINKYRFHKRVHHVLCGYYILINDLNSAIRSLEREIEIHGMNLDYFLQLIGFLIRDKQKERLLGLLEYLEVVASARVDGRMVLAELYIFLGRFESAKQQIEDFPVKIEQLDPTIAFKIVHLCFSCCEYEKGIYLGSQYALNSMERYKPLDLLMIEGALKTKLYDATSLIKDFKSSLKEEPLELKGHLYNQFLNLEFFSLMESGQYQKAFQYQFEKTKQVNTEKDKLLHPGQPMQNKKILVLYNGFGVEYIRLMEILKKHGAHVVIYCSDSAYQSSFGLLDEFERLSNEIEFHEWIDYEEIDAWLFDYLLPSIIFPHVLSFEQLKYPHTKKKNSKNTTEKIALALLNDDALSTKSHFLSKDVEQVESFLSAFDCINLHTYTNFPIQLDSSIDTLITNQVNVAKYLAYKNVRVFLFVSIDDALLFSGSKEKDFWFDNLYVFKQECQIGWSEIMMDFETQFKEVVINQSNK